MKWIAKSLFMLLLCVLGVGFARGWFVVSKAPDTESNKVNINLTVDPDKVKEDTEKVKDLPNKLKEEAEKSGQQKGKETPDPQSSRRASGGSQSGKGAHL
jgi:hypothetical protein